LILFRSGFGIKLNFTGNSIIKNIISFFTLVEDKKIRENKIRLMEMDFLLALNS